MKGTFANAVNVMILVDVYLVHLVEEQFVTGYVVDPTEHQDAFDDCVDGQHHQSDCQWTKDIWLNCHVVQAHPPVSSSCIAHVCAIHADILVLRWDVKVDKLVVERPSVNIRLQEEFVATSCQSHRKSQAKFHKKYAREQDPVDGVVFPQGTLGEGLCVEIGNRRNHPADPVEEEKFDFVNDVVGSQEIEAEDKRHHHGHEKLQCRHIEADWGIDKDQSLPQDPNADVDGDRYHSLEYGNSFGNFHSS